MFKNCFPPLRFSMISNLRNVLVIKINPNPFEYGGCEITFYSIDIIFSLFFFFYKIMLLHCSAEKWYFSCLPKVGIFDVIHRLPDHGNKRLMVLPWCKDRNGRHLCYSIRLKATTASYSFSYNKLSFFVRHAKHIFITCYNVMQKGKVDILRLLQKVE